MIPGKRYSQRDITAARGKGRDRSSITPTQNFIDMPSTGPCCRTS